jgi:hypothetical protein
MDTTLGNCMRLFFLASFIAAVICSIVWTGIIIFAIATSRFSGMGMRGIALIAPLVFFIWGARQTFGFFKDAHHR